MIQRFHHNTLPCPPDLASIGLATDAERAAIGLASQAEGSMNFILTDSQAGFQSVLNLRRGAPPRSGIEVEIKAALTKRDADDTAISWIRSQIRIPGNERADPLTAFASIHGDISLAEEIATEGGVRQSSKASRAAWRHNAGFGKRRSEWHRHALSGYTWMRTNKGPQ